MSKLEELTKQLEELEKQRDDIIAEVAKIRKRGKIAALFGGNTLIAVTIHKERGTPVNFSFSNWREVKKLKDVIMELLEGEDG